MLESEAFRSGDFDTHFLEGLDLSPPAVWRPLVAAAAALYRHALARRRTLEPRHAERSGWVGRSRREWSDHARRASDREEGR